MVNVLQNFEEASGQLNPWILLGPGAAAVLLGLIIWLAGVRFRRCLLAVVGCLVGGICGFFVIGPKPLLAAFAGTSAAVGAIFQRVFVAMLAALLAATIVFCVLARPYIEDARLVGPPKQGQTLSWGQSVLLVESYANGFEARVRNIGSAMPNHNWAILAGAAAVCLVGGFLFWRPASALCFATFGAMLIFSGTILLLLQRGITSISAVFYKPSLYAIVFGAMAAFGVVVQLILCKKMKKSTKAKGAGKGSDESSSRKNSWRTE